MERFYNAKVAFIETLESIGNKSFIQKILDAIKIQVKNCQYSLTLYLDNNVYDEYKFKVREFESNDYILINNKNIDLVKDYFSSIGYDVLTKRDESFEIKISWRTPGV